MKKSRDGCCNARNIGRTLQFGSDALHCITVTLVSTLAFTVTCTHYHYRAHVCQRSVTFHYVEFRISSEKTRLHYAILGDMALCAHMRTHTHTHVKIVHQGDPGDLDILETTVACQFAALQGQYPKHLAMAMMLRPVPLKKSGCGRDD